MEDLPVVLRCHGLGIPKGDIRTNITGLIVFYESTYDMPAPTDIFPNVWGSYDKRCRGYLVIIPEINFAGNWRGYVENYSAICS